MFAPFLLARPLGPGGGRNRHFDILVSGEHGARKRGLARPARGREHQHQTVPWKRNCIDHGVRCVTWARSVKSSGGEWGHEAAALGKDCGHHRAGGRDPVADGTYADLPLRRREAVARRGRKRPELAAYRRLVQLQPHHPRLHSLWAAVAGGEKAAARKADDGGGGDPGRGGGGRKEPGEHPPFTRSYGGL